MRIPIILIAALALSLSGAIIVIGAVNPSSQSSAPRIEIGDPAQTQSADEWEGAWSDSLAVLYEERQTKITWKAFGLDEDLGNVNQSWHTPSPAAIAAEEQYWARYSAYCLAIADFNNRLKRLTETDPELAWDPTVYQRYSFDYSIGFLWMCQLPQLPPTEADWQPHVIWTPFGEGYVTPDPICMEHDFVIQGPVNEVGGLGLGTPGEVGIFRVVCVTPAGEELYYKDHRHIWTEFVIEKTVEVPVQTPRDWPWSPEKIAEERAIIELNASLDGVPVVYPPYLSDEFITTGKIMTYPIGTSTAGWVLQP